MKTVIRVDYGHCPECGTGYQVSEAEVVYRGEMVLYLYCPLAVDGPHEEDDPGAGCSNDEAHTVTLVPAEG